MNKRKSNKSRKPGVATSTSTPKLTISAANLSGSVGEELQAAPEAETRLPELAGKETETALPRAATPEFESKPELPPQPTEPKLDVAPAVGAPAEAEESACTATGEAKVAAPSPAMDGPRRAIAGMEACQTLLMELTRENFDFATNLASMRSPLDIVDVATKFAVRRIGMYGKFSKTVADIAAGRQVPMT